MQNVKITLVDLSVEVSETSEIDDSLRRYIDTNILSSARTAQQDLSFRLDTLIEKDKEEESTDEDVGERLRKKIFRFVRCKDRYSALTSLLLKSWGYYQAYHVTKNATGDLEKLPNPVIDLPRTEKGKPYIPTASPGGKLSESRHSMNVSHQHPFAGMAQLNPSEDENGKVGFDIVTFDGINTRLYNTVRDFLEVFRSTFTDWEWNKILSKERVAGEATLIEFYLRWSIKEAYTKALGEGMNLDFKTFETRLQGIDDDDQDLWKTVLQSGKEKGFMVKGTISLDINSRNERTEDVDLFFLAIEGNDDGGKGYLGCATVCLAPSGSHKNDGDDHFPGINWMTLESLVAWHSNTEIRRK